MQLVDRILRLSATDLANHLGCAYLSQRSRAAAEGRAVRPVRNDPVAALLTERGIAHEAAYLEHLRRVEGLSVTTIAGDDGRGSREQTLAAMRAGADV